MATMTQMYDDARSAEREADYREQQAESLSDPRERESELRRVRHLRERAEQLRAEAPAHDDE